MGEGEAAEERVKGRRGGGGRKESYVCMEERGFRNSLRSPRQALSFSAFSFLPRVRGIRLRSLHDSLNTLAASFCPLHRPFISPPCTWMRFDIIDWCPIREEPREKIGNVFYVYFISLLYAYFCFLYLCITKFSRTFHQKLETNRKIKYRKIKYIYIYKYKCNINQYFMKL